MSNLKMMSNVLALAMLGVLFYPGAAQAGTFRLTATCQNPVFDSDGFCEVGLFDQDFNFITSDEVSCDAGENQSTTISTTSSVRGIDLFAGSGRFVPEIFTFCEDRTDSWDGNNFGENRREIVTCFTPGSKLKATKCEIKKL